MARKSTTTKRGQPAPRRRIETPEKAPPASPIADARPTWTPPVDADACIASESNLNAVPAGSGDRLLLPCSRPASQQCPTCGHRYCAEHWKRHWQRDSSRPGSHGWCSGSIPPKAARRAAR